MTKINFDKEHSFALESGVIGDHEMDNFRINLIDRETFVSGKTCE